MKIHILGRNALNCALYLEFNESNYLLFDFGQLLGLDIQDKQVL